MATIFKPTYSKPIPSDAEIVTRKGKRVALIRGSNGRMMECPLTKSGDRCRIKAESWYIRYRDENGVKQTVKGYPDKGSTKQEAATLEKVVAQVKSKTLDRDALDAVDLLAAPLADHFEAFMTSLESSGTSAYYRKELRRAWDRVCKDCGFRRLADLRPDKLEKWLVDRTREGMHARARNAYRKAAVAFANWCADPKRIPRRLQFNPFAKVAVANEKEDRCRVRRALTADELQRLLDAARRRPLLEAQTIRRGKRKGQIVGNVRPEVRERLERLGRERALIYKTFALTGLRRKELATLTVGSLHLDECEPCIMLAAANEKSREGNAILLRHDLADDLRQWLADEGQRRGGDMPMDARVFSLPREFVRSLDCDLKAAGIPKTDDRGRTVDVHALRHTFGTLLSKGGVLPKTAQLAMRHSTIDLTMNVYTDPRLIDVRGALDVLPALPLTGEQPPAEARRTETAG